MVGKRERSEGAYGRVVQDPRDMVKAAVLDPQSPAVQGHAPCSQRLSQGQPERASNQPALAPSAGWAVENDSTQGDGRGTYVALVRRRPREGGMAYGARALRSRSCRSSRGGHGPPGRPGKPATGRRAAGGRQEGREGGEMPSADLRNCSSTGERCA